MKLTPRLHKALEYSATLHRNQVRKSHPVPYIIHPVAVMILVSEYTNDEETLIAALLHDVVEDVKGYNLRMLTKDFGTHVSSIVKQISEDKDPSQSRRRDILTWEARKAGYLKQLNRAGKRALLVCAADKIHNLLSLQQSYHIKGVRLWNDFNASKEKTFGFYDNTLTILQRRLKSPIVKVLADTLHDTKRVVHFPD